MFQEANFCVQDEDRDVPPADEVSTVFDTLVYLAATLFDASAFTLQMMNGVGILVRNTFEHLVDYAIASKLSHVLNVNRMAFLCRLTEGKNTFLYSIFGEKPPF